MLPQNDNDMENSVTEKYVCEITSHNPRFFDLPDTGRLYPQCPVCGKFKTLHKVGNVYVCRSCHRLTRVFNWGKPKNARH